ncbi:macro domain-containing protein [Selenomonas ruminantium]|uniref:O-acetyl-ADP-ribose deacetylase (Regulator of RNase III), contains Macro domain n=1 Tax=Selenomonas ruminantium TaxID=971 RepID=A0A1K1M6F2_SELRU|nr:macro domain-containing protein [Selenomonas ruminantium]SFW18720.1 O-acetyl-ADP-ribose deacetylase (regulator of RNase III), contains Macro domain [Selenomonas ruminantium]
MPLEIVRNDITKMQVDAIVNTANPHPIVGGGVDRAIHKAAGTELLSARKKIGDIATGKAAITSAFNLHARFVIHTVGPVWQDGKHGERELLADCYANSLKLAAENKCSSVAFPLISAGVFGCPSEIAIAVATQAIRKFLADHDMDVYLVVFDHKAFKISSSLFDDVQSFIDERYIEELLDEEYRGDYRDRRRNFETAGQPPAEDAYIDIPMWMSKPKERSLEDLLNEVDDTFSEALLRLIDAKGKTDPEVYKQANIDRKLFSKIRNNPAYKPSKATALAFAVALELNLDETRDFIGRAGYALSHSNKADIIVEYFIRRAEYDIFTINETLFAFHQPLLGC